MRHHVTTVVLVCTAALLVGARAQAQWNQSAHPSRGVCFYEHPNYEGRSFCAAVDDDALMVPVEANDKISSMRIYGSVEVTVYKDRDFRGSSHRFTSSMSNLGTAGWGDRISSYRVEKRSSSSNGGWGGAYGGGGWGGSGSGQSTGWGGAYGGGSRSDWNNKDGGRWTYQQADSMVRRAYKSVLGREPDPGARSWVEAVLKNNWTQQQLEAELMRTPEYRNKR